METIYCKSEEELLALSDNNFENRESSTGEIDGISYMFLHARGKNGEHLVFKKPTTQKNCWVKPIEDEPNRNTPEGNKVVYLRSLYKLLINVISGESSIIPKTLAQTNHYINSYRKYYDKKSKNYTIDPKEFHLSITQAALTFFCKENGVDESLLLDELIYNPEIQQNPSNEFLKDIFETIAGINKEKGLD